MQMVITVKIVTHGCVGMTGMAVNTVISRFLKRGIQPKVKVDESLGMHTYICSVHLWESSKWSCPTRTMTRLSKAFSHVHGVFKRIIKKKGLEF